MSLRAQPLLRAEQRRRAIRAAERDVDVVQHAQLARRRAARAPARGRGRARRAAPRRSRRARRAQPGEQPEAAVDGRRAAERDEHLRSRRARAPRAAGRRARPSRVRRGSRSRGASSPSPTASAASTRNVPSPQSPIAARSGRPSASCASTSIRSAAPAAQTTASVPSPPSASAQRAAARRPALRTPSASASAASKASSAPRSLSGAQTTRGGGHRPSTARSRSSSEPSTRSASSSWMPSDGTRDHEHAGGARRRGAGRGVLERDGLGGRARRAPRRPRGRRRARASARRPWSGVKTRSKTAGSPLAASVARTVSSRVFEATAIGRRPAIAETSAVRARHRLDAELVEHGEVAGVDLVQDAGRRRLRQPDPVGDAARACDRPSRRPCCSRSSGSQAPPWPSTTRRSATAQRTSESISSPSQSKTTARGAGAHARSTANAISAPPEAKR